MMEDCVICYFQQIDMMGMLYELLTSLNSLTFSSLGRLD